MILIYDYLYHVIFIWLHRLRANVQCHCVELRLGESRLSTRCLRNRDYRTEIHFKLGQLFCSSIHVIGRERPALG